MKLNNSCMNCGGKQEVYEVAMEAINVKILF